MSAMHSTIVVKAEIIIINEKLERVAIRQRINFILTRLRSLKETKK